MITKINKKVQIVGPEINKKSKNKQKIRCILPERYKQNTEYKAISKTKVVKHETH